MCQGSCPCEDKVLGRRILERGKSCEKLLFFHPFSLMIRGRTTWHQANPRLAGFFNMRKKLCFACYNKLYAFVSNSRQAFPEELLLLLRTSANSKPKRCLTDVEKFFCTHSGRFFLLRTRGLCAQMKSRGGAAKCISCEQSMITND